MAKKHHMTKHQYKTYAKNHRSRTHVDDELGEATLSEKMRKRDEEKLLNQLRHFHGHAADLLEDERIEGENFAEGEEFAEEDDEMTG